MATARHNSRLGVGNRRLPLDYVSWPLSGNWTRDIMNDPLRRVLADAVDLLDQRSIAYAVHTHFGGAGNDACNLPQGSLKTSLTHSFI
jgi:hypothetical protein